MDLSTMKIDRSRSMRHIDGFEMCSWCGESKQLGTLGSWVCINAHVRVDKSLVLEEVQPLSIGLYNIIRRPRIVYRNWHHNKCDIEGKVM